MVLIWGRIQGNFIHYVQGVKKEGSLFTGVFSLNVIWSETIPRKSEVLWRRWTVCPYVCLCRLELNPLKLACRKVYGGNNIIGEGTGAMGRANIFVLY